VAPTPPAPDEDAPAPSSDSQVVPPGGASDPIGMGSRRLVLVGRIGKAHGLAGEVRIEPMGPGDALRGAAWICLGPSPIDARRMRVEGLRGHTGRLLLKLEGIDDPDTARSLTGSRAYVRRCDFPPAGAGEYYYTDLIGLRVRVAEGGATLGLVDEVLSTPAFDVLVVRGGEGGEERLVPFTRAVLREVRLPEGEILVSPPETWEEREGSPSRGQARRGRGHAGPRRGQGPKRV